MKIVFPAGAGVIPTMTMLQQNAARFPRRCGGDPKEDEGFTLFEFVFPAGAGVILLRQAKEHGYTGFPRRCGGDPRTNRSNVSYYLFSPQVRG